jgi:hypothetical protein
MADPYHHKITDNKAKEIRDATVELLKCVHVILHL